MDELSSKDICVTLAEMRYKAIAYIVDATVSGRKQKPWTFTDLLDQVFLHRVLGIPVFLSLLWAAFQFTFAISEPFMALIELIFGELGEMAEMNIGDPHLASFLSRGVFDGLGSVLVFVPPIFMMFLLLSILEDSGYMARAAFVMDRIMNRLGLHGRSFMPMIMGFGCNVPAIMATRSIDSEKDRMITILVNPLISCGARLPVFVLVSGAVFGSAYAGTAVFSMYVLGIALAIIMALIFRRTLFQGEPSPFMLELPAYTLPSAKTVLIHMWGRGKYFLTRAGTRIFGVVILIWFLSVHPWEATCGGTLISNSYIASLGHFMEPLFKPFGWDWMTTVALLFGFLAKEVIVGTYGVLLGAEEETVGQSLISMGMFTPLTGFAFMAFVLIYVPCVATITTVSRETNSWKLTAFLVAYLVALAFVVSGLIIGVGRLFGLS